MQRAASAVILSLSLLGCGDDDPAPELKPNCVIAVTLTGDVEASFKAGENHACGSSISLGIGIDTAFIPNRVITGIELRIADVLERETGGFNAGVIVTTEELERYATSLTGCGVAITEHRLESTEATPIGEHRRYQVVGFGGCDEPALPADMMGQISLSEFSFRTPVVWTD